jgi:hypothetical protein
MQFWQGRVKPALAKKIGECIMHVSFEGLLMLRGILSRGLLGRDPYTGEIAPMAKELPPGVFRHLRRLLRDVNSEIDTVTPEHKKFVEKWAVDGKFPEKENEKFGEFSKEYREFFQLADIVLAFSPFKLEMLDNLKEPAPVELMNIMEDLNGIYEEEQKQNTPAKGDSNIGSESPKADAN